MVNGYDIPKGSSIVANLSAIMHNPKYFEEPQHFRPERHLDASGRFMKSEYMVPFGIGKRQCMGELLARNQVFLFFVTLLEKVKFLPPLHAPTPSPDNYIVNL